MLRGVRYIIEYILSVAKVTLLLLLALFLPRLFLHYASQEGIPQKADVIHHHFKLGLENVSPVTASQLFSEGSARIGLITNHTGKDQTGRRNIDILLKKGCKIVALFTPKHGFHATRAEHQKESVTQDSKTAIPIIDWYAHAERNKALEDVDIVVFDMQDSGMRHGYATTLLGVMKETARMHKKMVVLDRPNVLGSYMEGSLMAMHDPKAGIPVPIRHGMTVGELATYFNKNILETAIDLQVVPMENYVRHVHADAKGPHQLSPNIATVDACYGYSFLGLLGEISPFDIGLGSDKAFQCLLLPETLPVSKQQWLDLRDILKRCGIESKYYRTFSERKKKQYAGLKIHIQDINNFSAFNALLAVLQFFKKNTDVPLVFSARFDNVVGTPKIREFVQGAVRFKDLESHINNELTAFFTKAMDSFIYKPLPQIVRV
jgi:uncharacterized protein YbbC (DUF1343 family)